MDFSNVRLSCCCWLYTGLCNCSLLSLEPHSTACVISLVMCLYAYYLEIFLAVADAWYVNWPAAVVYSSRRMLTCFVVLYSVIQSNMYTLPPLKQASLKADLVLISRFAQLFFWKTSSASLCWNWDYLWLCVSANSVFFVLGAWPNQESTPSAHSSRAKLFSGLF